MKVIRESMKQIKEPTLAEQAKRLEMLINKFKRFNLTPIGTISYEVVFKTPLNKEVKNVSNNIRN